MTSSFEYSDWLIDKVHRAHRYFSYVYGYKRRECSACNGSGYYDSHRSPKCGACSGTKVETHRGPKATPDAFEINCPHLFRLHKIISERSRR